LAWLSELQLGFRSLKVCQANGNFAADAYEWSCIERSDSSDMVNGSTVSWSEWVSKKVRLLSLSVIVLVSPPQ